MAIWDDIKDILTIARVRDEAFHAAALQEVQAGIRRDGLWAKAIIRTHGDESRAKADYLALLVEAIKDEQRLAAKTAESPALPAAPVDEWYYMQGSKIVGPLCGREMKLVASRLRVSTPVRCPETFEWTNLASVRQLIERQ